MVPRGPGGRADLLLALYISDGCDPLRLFFIYDQSTTRFFQTEPAGPPVVRQCFLGSRWQVVQCTGQIECK